MTLLNHQIFHNMARWHSCNILQMASDASRLWHFDARGGGFALGREHSAAIDQLLPSRLVAKSWSSLWQPRLNVAWLPPENVFLRVVELPRSNFEETFAMVELQLEKLSPMPVAQIVWTIHILSRHGNPPRPKPAGAAAEETKPEDLQTVVVVIAERSVVEEFLGKLEGRGYLADRLEVPMLDQLEATPATEDGAWIYPVALAGQSAALVAWWCGGTLRNLSYVVLPPAGDRAKALKAQLAQLAWAGELEGWLTAPPSRWHLVADPGQCRGVEKTLREGLSEPVEVTPPLTPAELAARTARRAAAAGFRATLLPAEFPVRYHQQFVDRLWLRGLVTTGVLYAIGVVIYFCAAGFARHPTRKAEQQVADMSGSYTNAMLLKAEYDVLKERQDLKYAALDCWKIVAEQMPADITLQRFSFADGQKLSLSGTAARRQVNALFDFNTAMQKATVQRVRPMFDPHAGDPVSPHSRKQRGELEFQPATAKLGGGAMKKYFAQLRPLERRLAVGALAILIVVLNAWVRSGRTFPTESPEKPGSKAPTKTWRSTRRPSRQTTNYLGAGKKPGRPGRIRRARGPGHQFHVHHSVAGRGQRSRGRANYYHSINAHERRIFHRTSAEHHRGCHRPAARGFPLQARLRRLNDPRARSGTPAGRPAPAPQREHPARRQLSKKSGRAGARRRSAQFQARHQSRKMKATTLILILFLTAGRQGTRASLPSSPRNCKL